MQELSPDALLLVINRVCDVRLDSKDSLPVAKIQPLIQVLITCSRVSSAWYRAVKNPKFWRHIVHAKYPFFHVGMEESAYTAFLRIRKVSRNFPLHGAVLQNDPGYVRRLASGYDVNQLDDEGKAPIHYVKVVNTIVLEDENIVVRLPEITAMLTALLEVGANINLKDRKKGRTLLHTALAEQCVLELLQFFLARGAQGDLRDKEGITAFYIAIRKKMFVPSQGHITLDVGANIYYNKRHVNLFLQNGLTLDFVNPETGDNYLHIAARRNDLKFIDGLYSILFKNRGELTLHQMANHRNYSGMTPILVAASKGHDDFIRLLLWVYELGVKERAKHFQNTDEPYVADINLQGCGKSVLSWVGARYRVRRKEEMGTEKDHAQSLKNLVIKEVIEAGAVPNEPFSDFNERTLLQEAASQGDKFFIEGFCSSLTPWYEQDRNRVLEALNFSKHRKTALDFAVENEMFEVVEVLEKEGADRILSANKKRVEESKVLYERLNKILYPYVYGIDSDDSMTEGEEDEIVALLRQAIVNRFVTIVRDICKAMWEVVYKRDSEAFLSALDFRVEGKTALDLALENNFFDGARILYRYGARRHSTSSQAKLNKLFEFDKVLKNIRTLGLSKQDQDFSDTLSIFLESCEFGYLGFVKNFIRLVEENPAEEVALSEFLDFVKKGKSALDFAIENGFFNVATFLVEKGARKIASFNAKKFNEQSHVVVIFETHSLDVGAYSSNIQASFTLFDQSATKRRKVESGSENEEEYNSSSDIDDDNRAYGKDFSF